MVMNMGQNRWKIYTGIRDKKKKRTREAIVSYLADAEIEEIRQLFREVKALKKKREELSESS